MEYPPAYQKYSPLAMVLHFTIPGRKKPTEDKFKLPFYSFIVPQENFFSCKAFKALKIKDF